MAVVATFLRKQKVQVYPYLDNWLIKGHTRALVDLDISLIWTIFDKLGLNKCTEVNSCLYSEDRAHEAVLDSVQLRPFLLGVLILSYMLHHRGPQKLSYYHGKKLPETPGTYGCRLHVCRATCETAAQTSPSLASLNVLASPIPLRHGGHASFFSDRCPPLMVESTVSLLKGPFL